MAITAFGKAIRKARIDADTNLASMATELNTTPSFLSAMEMGRKKIPREWVSKIESYFFRRGVSLRLGELADVANNSVSLEGLSSDQKLMIAGFARVNLTESELSSLQELLATKK